MELFLFVLPFLVLISWTASNSLIKGGLKSFDSGFVSLIVVGFGLIPIFVYFLFFHNSPISVTIFLLGLLSGALLSSGYILFYRGLGVESLSSAGVTINIQQVIVIMIAIFVLFENATVYEYIGIGCIILGAILVTIQNAPAKRKYLLIAGIANIIWGVYYLPLSESITLIHLSSIPLLLGRLSGTFILLAYETLRIHKNGFSWNGKFFLILCFAGFFDGLGNVFYSYAIQAGVFITSGAIVALLPATLALVGFIYYRDKLTFLKVLGISISVMGAIVISMF